MSSHDIFHSPTYECDVCGSDFDETDGVLACTEHFYCNDCAIEVFHRSMTDINEFSASCCAQSRSGLPPSLFQDLLGKDFMEKYFLKLHEHYTPQAIRVYCANAQCAAYQHPRSFDNSDHRYTTITCGCGTKTCVGCKSPWSENHICVPTGSVNKPTWLPPYSADHRIKQCPNCKEWIQLSEACNHMKCLGCLHEFCFVCMLPFTSFHDNTGCPMYGDPRAGYDDEGYEKTNRGLHIYTGRDRDGYDRNGYDRNGRNGPDALDDFGDMPQLDPGDEVDVPQFLPNAVHNFMGRVPQFVRGDDVAPALARNLFEWPIREFRLQGEQVDQMLANEAQDWPANPGRTYRFEDMVDDLGMDPMSFDPVHRNVPSFLDNLSEYAEEIADEQQRSRAFDVFDESTLDLEALFDDGQCRVPSIDVGV